MKREERGRKKEGRRRKDKEGERRKNQKKLSIRTTKDEARRKK